MSEQRRPGGVAAVRSGDSLARFSDPVSIVASGAWQPKEPAPDAMIVHGLPRECRSGEIRSVPMAETH